MYDFLPTAPQATPNTGSTELFPDNPLSTPKIWTTFSWQLATWEWRHMPLNTHFWQPSRHWNLPHTRFTCRWNHNDLNFQGNHWLLLHHWWRTKIYPWPNWCRFYWRSQSLPSLPDSHLTNSELHCHHQKLCHHNLFPSKTQNMTSVPKYDLFLTRMYDLFHCTNLNK